MQPKYGFRGFQTARHKTATTAWKDDTVFLPGVTDSINFMTMQNSLIFRKVAVTAPREWGAEGGSRNVYQKNFAVVQVRDEKEV